MLHAKLHKDDEVWDELVQSIESSSIFISSAFLKPLSSVRIAIHKGEEVRALFVCTGDKKMKISCLVPRWYIRACILSRTLTGGVLI